nr:Rep [Forsythia suspensa CRESS virus]
MSFQLNSKTICLTYSNITKQFHESQLSITTLESGHWITEPTIDINLANECFMEFISTRDWGKDISVEYCIIARESHESGDHHYHVGIRFTKPIRTKDPRKFDILGFHPNIQPAKDFQRWVAYCKKDGVFAEYGTIITEKKSIRVTPDELIHLAKTMNKGEFLAYCSVGRYPYANEIWNQNHKTDHCTILSSDNITGTYDPCFDKLITSIHWDQSKCLLLIGDSGIGKTTWCKKNMPKPCLMVTHLDDLKRFEPGVHTSILFDDVSIKHLPDTSQIHLVDYENPRSIHIRYGVARIPSGIVKAFTCNTIPVNIDMPAISRRCQMVRITKMDTYHIQ